MVKTAARYQVRTMKPGFNLSVSSFLLMIALSGNPLAKPYIRRKPTVSSSPLHKFKYEKPFTYLSHSHNIRPHPTPLTSKVLPGPPEARLHFIHDQQHPMLITNLTQSLQISRRRNDVASLAEDRFDEDGCGVGWGGLLGEYEFELVERLADKLILRRRRGAVEMVPIRERCREDSGLNE